MRKVNILILLSFVSVYHLQFCVVPFERFVLLFKNLSRHDKIMYRGLVFVAILCVVFGHENGLEPHKEHSKEKFAIDVKIVEEEESENGPRKTEVKVCCFDT